MSSFHVLGNTLVTNEEYKEKLSLGQISELFDAAEANKDFSLDVETGTVNSSDLSSERIPYSPIGIGKPLSVEILTLYTGDFIPNGLFSAKKRDLICVSGTKSSASFNASARALNMLEPKVREKTYLKPSAFQAGTRYIYYTKAVDDESLDISVELDANSFNENIFSIISSLMEKAAGTPLFIPASGYVLAGSQVMKIVEKTGRDLFESSPFIKNTTTIRFATGGLPTSIARSIVVCIPQHVEELKAYNAGYIEEGGNYEMRLLKDGQIYSGNAPYIIINIDGAEKPSLNSFTPTLASASLLKTFYASDNKMQEAGAILHEALQLYNDLTYRNKAVHMEKVIKQSNPGSEAYKKAKELQGAYVKNIVNELFRRF